MRKLFLILILGFIPIAAMAPATVRKEICVLESKSIIDPFILFVKHLGFKESNNNWKIVNTIGCYGEYQFRYKTLVTLGYGHITPAKFKANPEIFPPELQFKVLQELLRSNEVILTPYFNKIGKTVKGIEITKAGLLAGAHLGGARSVIMYLKSDGKIDKRDRYGTKISDYIREFGIYKL